MGTKDKAENRLAAHLDGLVKEIRQKLAKALYRQDEDAIHAARVVTRRLTAAAELYEEHLPKRPAKRFKRGLKQIRRALADLRDLDVMSAHLRELHAEKAACDFAAKHLKDERKAAAQDAKKMPTWRLLRQLGDWPELHKQINRHLAAEMLRKLLLKQLDMFCKRADRQTVKAPLSPSAAQRDAAKKNPHELRIAGKELRYTMELAFQDGFPIPPVIYKRMKDMQTALGAWHDYVVLTEWLMKLSARAHVGYWDSALQRALLGLVSATAEIAERHLEQFAKQWKVAGADVCRMRVGLDARH